MAALKYANLDWNPGQKNVPGISEDVYAISKAEILAWPTLPAVFVANIGELVTYSGNFTLELAAKWKKVGVIAEKSNLDGKSQGTKPSKTFLNQIVMQHPGAGADASAYAMQANNDDLVYLAKENNTGKYRVVGNEMFPTNTEADQKLGGSPTDEMGTTLTVTVTDVAPALYYTGAIITDDGIINPGI